MADDTGIAPFNPGASTPARPAQPSQPRQIAPNVQVVDFNDESVVKYEFIKYSGKQDYTDRIYIVNANDIVKARTHYHDKLRGGAVLCQSVYERNQQGTQENLVQEAFCCKLLGPSSLRFAALIVQYDTKQNGVLSTPFGMSQKLWLFGADKYAQLRGVNKDFPLENFDLGITCTDAQWQKMNIGAKPECYLNDPGFPKPVRDGVFAWAKASVPKMPGQLGRAYTEQDLMKAMREAGILQPAGTPAPSMVGPQDNPVADFSSILGIGGGTVVGEQPPQS